MSDRGNWTKSSYSNDQGGACVEVAASPSSVLVRDSKDKAGPRLSFSPSAWADFVAFAAEAQAPEGE
ncbi:DUF397 domain-containing protein [Kitasatospora sp. NPDC094019]|uniref:DUF397 domain-containing protein n=1 Tax=Kitasatospora sp. NPDC094019 TaxID=3364091 RepID=UPI0037F9E284